VTELLAAVREQHLEGIIALNSDGGGAITRTVQPPLPAVLQRTQLNVSDADGKKFLQMFDASSGEPRPTSQDVQNGRKLVGI
jgi:hypothetical protein